jgi:hypothetical protein
MHQGSLKKRWVTEYLIILLLLVLMMMPDPSRADTWNVTQVEDSSISGSKDMTIANHPVTGNPTIAYYEQSGSVYNVKYAIFTNVSWSITKIKEVATNGRGDLGIDLSYHPQTANPSFAYFYGYKNLYISTTVNGSSWTDEIVDTDCLNTIVRYKIDQTGTPWVAYNKIENISGRYFTKIASKH